MQSSNLNMLSTHVGSVGPDPSLGNHFANKQSVEGNPDNYIWHYIHNDASTPSQSTNLGNINYTRQTGVLAHHPDSKRAENVNPHPLLETALKMPRLVM